MFKIKIISFPENNTLFELCESSRASEIVNGFISGCAPIFDRLNPEAFTCSNKPSFSGNVLNSICGENMSFFQEFKTFAMRGNAVDLAIGVIIGAAFGKIVNSLVNDLIMPPIGMLLGGADFSNLSIKLHEATATTPAVELRYGTFINTVVDFSIIALCIFLAIKAINRLVPPAQTTTKECPQCLMTIPSQAKKCGHCQEKLDQLS